MQLFHPCYVVQQMETESGSFALSTIECKWVKADAKTKKLFLIFIQNLNFPAIKVNLYSLVRINLENFLVVNYGGISDQFFFFIYFEPYYRSSTQLSQHMPC
jgi:hypothetical protein